MKDNASVGVDKVNLTLSASETFGLLTITNELFHYRDRTGGKITFFQDDFIYKRIT